jgi:hypothetical protein
MRRTRDVAEVEDFFLRALPVELPHEQSQP